MYYLLIAGLQIQTAELQKLCLLKIEEMLMSNGRSLKDYPSLPQLDLSDVHTFNNRFIVDELQYNKQDMAKEFSFKALNDEQIFVCVCFRIHIFPSFKGVGPGSVNELCFQGMRNIGFQNTTTVCFIFFAFCFFYIFWS